MPTAEFEFNIEAAHAGRHFSQELNFVRNDEGALTGFEATNGRTRGALFERVK